MRQFSYIQFLNIDKCCDLEIAVYVYVTQGHWNFYYVLNVYVVLLQFCRNIGIKTHHFADL